MKQKEEIRVDWRYQPFSWLPHATLAKHLNSSEMKKAFEIMQNQFAPFESIVTKIGLAKTNPYRDLKILELK